MAAIYPGWLMMSSGANTTHYELGMTRFLFSTNHDGPIGMTEGFENCSGENKVIYKFGGGYHQTI